MWPGAASVRAREPATSVCPRKPCTGNDFFGTQVGKSDGRAGRETAGFGAHAAPNAASATSVVLRFPAAREPIASTLRAASSRHARKPGPRGRGARGP